MKRTKKADAMLMALSVGVFIDELFTSKELSLGARFVIFKLLYDFFNDSEKDFIVADYAAEIGTNAEILQGILDELVCHNIVELDLPKKYLNINPADKWKGFKNDKS